MIEVWKNNGGLIGLVEENYFNMQENNTNWKY